MSARNKRWKVMFLCFLLLKLVANGTPSESSPQSQQDPDPGACENSWVLGQNGKSCYKDLTEGMSQRSYGDAENACLDKSAHLVTIDSSAENNFVCNTIGLITPKMFTSKLTFIGIRIAENGQWQWTSGENVTYTNWRAGFPKTERCAYMSRECDWLAHACSSLIFAGWLCEKDSNPASLTTGYVMTESDTTTNTGLRCRRGWITWIEGESCYRGYSLPRDRDQTILVNTLAEEACQGRDAHLVSITSAMENEFIATDPVLRVPGTVLFFQMTIHIIGLRRSASAGDWEWVTGESMNFTNWKSSYLSDSQYNCVNINSDGRWFVKTSDDLSAYTINYICEYSLVEEVTSTPATVAVTSVEFTSLLMGQTESDTITNNEDVTATLNNRDQNNDSKGVSITLYVTIPTVVAALCVGVGIIWRVKKWKQIQANKKNKIEILELSQLLTTMLEDDVQMKLRGLLLHRSALELEQIQGRGAFGIVYRGRYSPVNHGLPAQSVAIKVLQGTCIGSDIRGLVDEAVTMTDFNHTHVMPIIGVCIDPDEGLPMLVMPYMENADLNSYLRRFIFEKTAGQIPDEKQLLIFCLHIARGMEYLSGLKFIHRDLAARNCMVDSNLIVKVADFGLSRDVYTSSYYRQDEQKMLPVKWMSLESLQYGVFTSHSDIWSFGVTMWEIMSLGRIPYPEVYNSDMLKHLETGARLRSPKNCPDEIYTTMSSCWRNNVEERPTFSNIAEQLMTYLARTCGYLELDIKATTSNSEGTTKEFNIYSGDDRVTDTDTGIYDGDNKATGDITNRDEEIIGEK